MMLVTFAALFATLQADNAMAEAAHALKAGRVEQARVMIAEAVGRGGQGPQLEQLLADFAADRGQVTEAFIRYEALSRARPTDPVLLELTALMAWRSGRQGLASDYARRATALPGVSWRAWNLLAVAADAAQDWGAADAAYAQALSLSPGRPEILNNQGWSQILRGRWESALELFEEAHKKAPSLPRLLNNLELVRSALADELPVKRDGESMVEWAARMNDAGVAAHRRGEMQRATAAFAIAIEAHPNWYERAGNNMRQVGKEDTPAVSTLASGN